MPINDRGLREWAKAEADTRRAPGQGDYLRGIADGLESGILHLAERLQDPDVIATLVEEFLDFEESVLLGVALGYENWAKDAITAMLIRVTEGDNK